MQILRDAGRKGTAKIALQQQSSVVFYYKCVQFAARYAAHSAEGRMTGLHD